MSAEKRLVLDANILVRGVFGVRVRSLLETYEDSAIFYSPDVCFDDASKYIPDLAARRSFDPQTALSMLDGLARIVNVVDRSLYEDYEEAARSRISMRDVEDWPVSLLLCCLIVRSGGRSGLLRHVYTFQDK